MVLCENEPIFNIIADARKVKYPFKLKGINRINGEESSLTNRFYKDVEQLTKTIEKKVDKGDESLEFLFTEEMIKYTLVFNKVKRSDFGTGCNVFKKNF